MTAGQDAQAQQVGQVTRIAVVVGILEPGIGLDRTGLGQVHDEAEFLQSVDQPVPVVGRLDHDAAQLLPMRFEQFGYAFEVIADPLQAAQR